MFIYHSYLATATYVPEQSKYYFYGGMEKYPVNSWYLDTFTNVNITNATFTKVTDLSKIGYYRMTTLDISSGASNVRASSAIKHEFFTEALFVAMASDSSTKPPYIRLLLSNIHLSWQQ